MSGQSGGHRLRLSKLNEQLTCKLCGGYFIDATTIIECLHSFCKSCIVKYLESNKYCPICEVQVHKSKPLLNIRPDYTLQDIVYKLVPGCYQNEMRCRREFYIKRPEARSSTTSPEARGEPIESHIYSPDESLSLSLEYYNPSLKEDVVDTKESTPKLLPRRYLRCPAAVTVFHLQKLIRAKYGLSEPHRVDVMYKEEPLCGSYSLMDVMYIYHWRRKVPLHLSYRIFESSPKRLKLSDDNIDFKQSLSNAGISPLEPKDEQSTKREWKEVQLKISETGVMSVTDISSPNSKKSTKIEDIDVQKRLDETVTAVETVNKSDIVLKVLPKDQEPVKSNAEAVENFSISDMDDAKSSKHLTITRQPDKSNIVQNDVNLELESTKNNVSTNSNSQQESNDLTKQQNDVQKNCNITKTQVESQKTGNCEESSNNVNKAASVEVQKSNQSQRTVQLTSNEMESNALENKNLEDKQILTNNNIISTEAKAENQKQIVKNTNEIRNSVTSAGSKIDALSVKLQFQPKVGQLNSTYLKKIPKEKKTALLNLKKLDTKSLSQNLRSETRISLDAGNMKTRTNSGSSTTKSTTSTTVPISQLNSSIASTQNTSTLVTAQQTNCLFVSSSATYVTAPSVSVSSVQNLSSIDRNGIQCTPSANINIQQTLNSPGQRTSSLEQVLTGSNQRPTSTAQISSSVTQKLPFTQNNNLPPSSESLASIGLNVSTAVVNLGQSNTNFPYTGPNIISNTILKSPKNSSPTSCQKQLLGTQNSNTVVPSSIPEIQTSAPQFSMQTASMSIYSVSTPVKNNLYSNVSQGINTTAKQAVPKTSFEITSVYSGLPCPDAIPISLMKPTVRKHEIISKGTNLNEICAKIGTSGSKINDICAKIGENSKEKNKAETRNKPEIPDLLKITRKSPSASEPVAKHIPNIPNVTLYTPSNSLGVAEGKNIYPAKEVIKNVSSPATSQSISTSHTSHKAPSLKKQTQPVGYKTLRDPPKSWNPTLSKNNYVAVKNQAKEMQNQSQTASTSDGNNAKPIASKPAKIFKMRNMPRYLGNPASGVKPMYGVTNETKEKEQSTPSTKNATLSMMKIDPKTLSPIVSTVNSPIVSPPPYSPNARSYQNTPFSRDICRNTNSPISPRNSPVNMLSTNPFIPSPTLNTNPRLIYSHFPPPFPDASRFPNPLIRSPIGIPPPSAFHSSLPPSINKLYQRTSYMPQTTNYSPVTQPPTVQRIPPSTHSSPKSPKTSSSSASSMFNLAKTETQTSISTSVENIALHLAKSVAQQELNAFNLSKSGNQGNVASDFSKTSSTDASGAHAKQNFQSSSCCTVSSTAHTRQSVTTSTSRSKPQLNLEIVSSDTSKKKSKEQEVQKETERQKEDVKSSKVEVFNVERKMDGKDVTIEPDEKEKISPKVNGDVTALASSGKSKDDVKSKLVEKTSEHLEKPSSREQSNTVEKVLQINDSKNASELSQNEMKNEDLEKGTEQIQGKKSEMQKNKAES